MHFFKEHFLLFTVVPLLFLAIAASYYRFMISYDYEVSFEGPCDPYSEQCFVYCEDEACLEPFYYSLQHRDAAALRNDCADLSVLDCEAALVCRPNETRCFLQYCDPSLDENCESLESDDKSFQEQINDLIENSNL